MIYSGTSSRTAKQVELVEVLASEHPKRNKLIKNLIGLLLQERDMRHEEEKRMWRWK